eukprot:scaffold53736_cov66-Phaeocystis_antarctica.AAC.2
MAEAVRVQRCGMSAPRLYALRGWWNSGVAALHYHTGPSISSVLLWNAGLCGRARRVERVGLQLVFGVCALVRQVARRVYPVSPIACTMWSCTASTAAAKCQFGPVWSGAMTWMSVAPCQLASVWSSARGKS